MDYSLKLLFMTVLFPLFLNTVWSQYTTNPFCDENSVRLVGGNSSLEGRVEVCINGGWGTVCSRSWDLSDAIVVCRELGHSTIGALALESAEFGQGARNILLKYVRCTGMEMSLVTCNTATDRYIGYPACDHSEDAGVRCQPFGTTPECVENSVRLVGGNSSLEGRVEVCDNGEWGTVCDNSWDFRDAAVVCRELGHSIFGAQAFGSAEFGQGTGRSVLSYVGCRGTETTLVSCSSSTSYCSHTEDAGVRCRPNGTIAECAENSVRLIGGNSSLEGRVEVCDIGEWGTVCDNGWDYRDATVVCRELGHSTFRAQTFASAEFGQGTGRIVLSYVGCRGTETTLVSCPSSTSYCSHTEDAGVRCQPNGTIPECVSSSVRLVGGNSSLEGRVEVCDNGEWGTVCNYGWDFLDAIVVCRELGHSTIRARAFGSAEFGQGTGRSVLSYVGCRGTETTLVSCYSSTSYCSHAEDAGVRCQPNGTIPECVSSSVRLVGGNSSLEGRVEVCDNGEWGTVCDNSWDFHDATVVCRELGHSTIGARAFASAEFGQGAGRSVLSYVRCRGTETTLVSCSSSTSRCSHTEDAGVRCQPNGTIPECVSNSVRLVGGNSTLEGRVEVCDNGEWGTVCDNSWDFHDATVVCRELGHSTIGAQAFTSAEFGQGTGRSVLSYVRCRGTETTLVSCSSSTSHCSNAEDAGVRCQPNGTIPECVSSSVRLVGGNSSLEGRVEVCDNGEWGTVCDNRWDFYDAIVVCRELGHSTFRAQAFTSAEFGQGTGRSVLSYVGCRGTETTLVSCSSSTSHCSNAEDAGVRCQPNGTVPDCIENSVRLVGRNSSLEGQVEICIFDEWETICSNDWDYKAAIVVCRELGHSTIDAQAFQYGMETIRTYTDWNFFRCSGTEMTLASCSSTPHYYYHYYCQGDAGVQCLPNVTITPSKPPSVLIGDYISFNCSPNNISFTNVSFMWTHLNSTTILEETSGILTLQRISQSQLGTYRCTVTATEIRGSADITLESKRPVTWSGAYRFRSTNDDCPSSDDILVDILQLLASEYGVHPLGLSPSYPAESCDQVSAVNPGRKNGLYWVGSGDNVKRLNCEF